MVQDITGTGSIISLIASNTFPAGIPITQFADDTDPMDSATVKITDVFMGVNGDLLSSGRAVAKPLTLSVIVGSIDDLNLQVIARANLVSAGKASALDVITISCVYPDGSVVSFQNGKMTDAQFAKSISSSGRLKTRTYSFMFQDVI